MDESKILSGAQPAGRCGDHRDAGVQGRERGAGAVFHDGGGGVHGDPAEPLPPRAGPFYRYVAPETSAFEIGPE